MAKKSQKGPSGPRGPASAEKLWEILEAALARQDLPEVFKQVATQLDRCSRILTTAMAAQENWVDEDVALALVAKIQMLGDDSRKIAEAEEKIWKEHGWL